MSAVDSGRPRRPVCRVKRHPEPGGRRQNLPGVHGIRKVDRNAMQGPDPAGSVGSGAPRDTRHPAGFLCVRAGDASGTQRLLLSDE